MEFELEKVQFELFGTNCVILSEFRKLNTITLYCVAGMKIFINYVTNLRLSHFISVRFTYENAGKVGNKAKDLFLKV